MKRLFVALAISFSVVTATFGDLKPQDSSAPVLQYFTPVEIAPKAGHTDAPNFTFDARKPLLTITSVRQLLLHRNGSGVTIVLNERDRKRYAELTHQFKGRLLICEGQGGIVTIVEITSPTDNGMIEFSDTRYTGDVAKYLRRRFGM